MDGSSYECMGEYDDQWVRTEGGRRTSRRWFGLTISIGDFAVLRPADRGATDTAESVARRLHRC